MIDAEETEEEAEVPVAEEAAEAAAEEVEEEKEVEEKTEEHMHADSACRTVVAAVAACSDTGTSASMMTSWVVAVPCGSTLASTRLMRWMKN